MIGTDDQGSRRRKILLPGDKKPMHPQRRAMSELSRLRATALLLQDGRALQEVSIVARDGAILRAWFVAAQQPKATAVVLLHGVGDSRLGIYGYAQPMLQSGYDVLLPDARAHGSSGGEIATYGLL